MAHFAKLDSNNFVISVHVVKNEVLDSENEEQSGIDFLSQLHNHNLWKQTSYNAKFRFNYAGIGFYYDEKLNAFIPPKPYESWVLNENICQWESPIDYPNDGKRYFWDENLISWIE